MKHNIAMAIVVGLLVTVCARESLLDDMRQIVPLYEGANVLDARSVKDDREAIIQFDAEASEASEEDIIEFYKQAMAEKGWTFESIERYPGDGSVFSMAKDEVGTLTVQTVIKKAKETGKIRVVLNLAKS